MKRAKKILVLDNYDSFTYNLVHMVRELGGAEVIVDVARNNRLAVDDLAAYDKIILSPGPGIPSEAGIMLDVIRRYAPTKSILGICLGEQAIGEAFGATLENLSEVYHGVAAPVRVVEKDVLFKGLEKGFEAGRYHSWIVRAKDFPDALRITAVDPDGRIMAIAHREYDVRGVQFHPESVLTPDGKTMISNWLNA